jgi:hypothetical protein
MPVVAGVRIVMTRLPIGVTHPATTTTFGSSPHPSTASDVDELHDLFTGRRRRGRRLGLQASSDVPVRWM